MDVTAAVRIKRTRPFEDVIVLVARTLNLAFTKDESGRYEEFAAVISDVLGFEVAILDCAPSTTSDDVEAGAYQLLVQTFIDTPDEEYVADLSVHLAHLLTEAGLVATGEPEPRGTPR